MGIFSDDREGYTIIVGCGTLGASLAGTLSDAGESVLVIDELEEAYNKLSPSYGGMFLTGDATQELVLQEAEIEKASALICVTNSDNTNIMVAQIAKELFNIKCVIARLYDPERECVYQEFGIDTICPTTLSAIEIRKLLDMSMVED